MNSSIKWRQLFDTTKIAGGHFGKGKLSWVFATFLLAQMGHAQTLYWNPSTNGVGIWDTGTQNWSTTLGGSANAIWTNGDTASFSGSSVIASHYTITLSGTETAGAIVFASGTATLSSGTLNLNGSGLVGVAGAPVEGIISSPITGSAPLVKFGLGQLDLQGINTFSGNLTNQAGILTLDNNQAAGGGAIVLSPNSSVVLNSSLPLVTLTNNVVFSGNGSTIEIDPGVNNTMVLAGVLSGTHPWNANGLGTLVLSNANSFGGILTVAQGTVVAAADGSLGGTTSGEIVIVSNNATLGIEGGITYSSDKQITLKGTGVGGGAAFNGISGDNIFQGTIVLATNSVIGASAGSLSFQGSGQVTGPFNITITGPGEVDLYTSDNFYSNTVVSSGTFGVWDSGSPGAGLVTVNSGAVFTGNNGSAAPGGVNLSGEIFPGEDLNTVSFGTADETWNGGGAYDWTIDDATGLAGTEPGYSTINISGQLTITSSHANPFTIHLMTLDPNFGGPGFAENFDNTSTYTWTIATASGGITGFDPSAFVVDPTGFENALGDGAFIVQQSGNSLVVSFVQKPQITSNPVSLTTIQCETAIFSVVATGTGPLQYQWYSNSVPVIGANATNFVISDVAFADAGVYSITVSNLSGYTATSSATLTVTNPPPMIVVNPITVYLNNGSYTLSQSDLGNLAAGSMDHCGNSFIASTNASPNMFVCGNVGTNIVTVTLMDISNQPAIANTMVIVKDLTPPTLVVNPITVTLDPTGNYTLTSSDIAALLAGSLDSCPVIATTNVSQTSFTFCEVGTNDVTVILTDIYGNSSTNNNAQVIVQKPANPPANVYVDASYATNCGLVAFPNGVGGANYYYGYNAFNTVQAGINAVATNGTVNVAAGPYSESDIANKPVILLGANQGVAGCGNRGSESVISSVGTALTITTSNVVVDGFELNGIESVQDNGNAGVVIQNNTMNASAAGVEVTNVTTTASAGLTVQDNCITLNSQLAGSTPTIGIGIAQVTGVQPPLIQSNNITGAYIGYLLYSLTTVPATVVQGGSITGVMQGIDVYNVNPLPGAPGLPLSPSTFGINGVTVSGFAGSYPALAGVGEDFQAGVYVFTTGTVPGTTLTGILTNVTVIGCSNISSDSSGLYFTDFSKNAGLQQQITVQNCNVYSNENRGVFCSGSNLVATVTASSILGNGFNPFGPMGNPGFGVIVRNNAHLTVSECLIANPAAQTAYTVTAVEADANTLILGPTLVVTNCSIINNGNGNLAGQDSGVLNASGNWWGTVSDTAIAGLMTGVVDFTPYLDGGVNAAPVGAGFQGNFGVLHVTALGAQTGGGPRVQEGVNSVTGASPIVIVQSGTYNEFVTLGTTGLTLEGAQNIGIPAWGVRGAESIMSSSNPNGIIQISGQNVTVNGMNTEGPGAAYGVNVNAGALNAAIIDTIMNGGTVGAGVFGTATLKNDIASNPANQVGILVNGASAAALIESNNLTGDTVAGIEATNGAIVDAGGDCTSSDVTGLGTGSGMDGSSAGGNVLTDYGFDNAAPWAIANYNSGTPAVLAYNNIYGDTVGVNLAGVFTGTVLADQAGGLLVQYPGNLSFQCSSSVPAGATSLAGFEAQNGVVSATVANVSFSDAVVSNSPNNLVITRTYTVTAACGQSASGNQVITVDNTSPPVVTSWPANRTLDVNGNCEVAIPDLTTQVVGAAVSCSDAIIITENPPAGTMVSLGTTNVEVTVSDTDGNAISNAVTLTVIDSTPPLAAYVDTNYANLPAGTVVNWPYNGVNGPHYVGCDAFAKIQDAVNRVATNGTVNVAAGAYVEDLTISQPLTLLGPNATNNPNTGTRVPEAIIEPATSGPNPYTQDEIIVYVATNHVTIKGFTVDGNNPSLSDGTLIGSVESYASEGIVSYEGVGWITVDNNIVRNTTYSGVDFYNYNNPAATATNYINCNRFDNLGAYGFGVGVIIYNNFYSDVADNFMTNLVVGIQTGNFSQSNPGTTQSINNNTISANGVGVFFNLMYDTTSTFTVSNNAIAFAYAAGSPEWDGMLVSSIQSGVNVNIQNNNIACSVTNAGYNEVGYNVWNTPTTGTVLIEGGTISNADYGVWINDYDGYASPGSSTTATINNVLISGASLAGVYVQDDPRASTNGVVVAGTVTGNTVITGGGMGVLVQGTNAAASVINNEASITGNVVGISVDTGKALIQNNDLTGNSVAGISVTNNAIVDAGDCSGADVTGLGTGSGSNGSSSGDNNLSGYNFGGTGPWAIEDFNGNGGATVLAENDNYGAAVGQNIASVINNPNSAVVDYSQGPAVATAPTNVTVVCASEVPVGATSLSQFIAQGGTYSANAATIAFGDSDSANLVGGTNVITITRTYTVTDTCGEATNCIQTITLNESSPALVVNPIAVTLNANGTYTLSLSDVVNLLAGSSDQCGLAGTNVSQTTFDCDNAGTNTVTVILTNIYGLTTTGTTTINVQDVTPPTLVVNPITVNLSSNGTYTLNSSDVAYLVGGSSNACGIATTNVSPNNFTFCNVGLNPVTVTLTDFHGNQSMTNALLVTVNPPPTPATVYVDAGYPATCGPVTFPNIGGTGTYYIGYNAFNTIQAGLNAAASGGTVIVAPGTYNESPTINNPVTLTSIGGTNAAATSIVLSEEPSPDYDWAAMIINGSSVTVEGFTIVGFDGPVNGSGPTAGYSSVDIFVDAQLSNPPAATNINIANNILEVGSYNSNFDSGPSAGYGISTEYPAFLTTSTNYFGQYAPGTSPSGPLDDTLNVHNNIFEPVDAPPAYDTIGSAFFINPAANFTFVSNTITGGLGISTTSATNSLIADNIVIGVSTNDNSGGFATLGYPDPDFYGGHATLEDNVISNTATGIAVFDSENVAIENNVLNGNGVGVSVQDSGFDPVYSGGNTVQISDNSLTNDLIGVINTSSNSTPVAVSNWWGNVSGPASAQNPYGTGSPVTGNVTVMSWLENGGNASPGIGFDPTAPEVYPPAQLVFTLEPGSAGLGSQLSPQPVVTVEDASNNPTPWVDAAVTMSISNNATGNGVLTGTTNITSVNGVATYTNLAITVDGGLGDTLKATAQYLTPALSIPIDIANPTPVALSLSPFFARANSGGFTLTVYGSNFVASSMVNWNGNPLPTTYLSSTQLTAAVPGSDITMVGTVPITVSSPMPGGGISSSLTFYIEPAVPTVVYVDTNYVNLPANTWVNWPYTGTGTNIIGYDAFATIQGGVNGVATNGTVKVAAGIYAENVLLNKSACLLGPNADIDPNTGTRVAEAVIVPGVAATSAQSSTSGTIIRVGNASSPVIATIKGFTLDGHNGNLSSGLVLNGVEIDTGAGIVNSIDSFDANPGSYDTTMVVKNNILQNLERYGVLADSDAASTPNAGTVVSHNKIDNMPAGNNFSTPGGGRGRGVAFEDNTYGTCAFNVMTRVNVGWQDDNFWQASPGAGTLVASNTISTYHRGIFHNLQYESATAATIQGNNIQVETSGDFSASSSNFGIELSSIESAVNESVIGNNVSNNIYGILIWNVPSTGNVIVSGGTVSGNQIGVWATSQDPQFGPATASQSVISNVTVVNAAIAGVEVDDSTATAATVATITGNNLISGNPLGVLVNGAAASASVLNNSASITGNGIGIEVNMGKALIQNNDLTSNSVAGICVTNNATVDAGDCSGADVTGLGTGSGSNGSSSGNNNLSGYSFGGSGPWAIEDFNSAGGPAVLAENDNYGAVVGQNIASVINDPNTAVVNYSQDPVAIAAPANMTIVCSSDVPAGATSLIGFNAQGGYFSGNTATVGFSDSDGTNIVGGTNVITITRTYTVTDSCGPQPCVQTITLNETPPVVGVSTNIVQSNDPGACGATVYFTVPAPTDNCGITGGSVIPPSGSFFPIGTTPVTVIATDGNGLSTTNSFTVTVNDTQPPAITNAVNIVQAVDHGQTYATVNFSVGATDNCAVASVMATPPSGSQFNIGTNTVTVTATDVHSNTSIATFTVAVIGLPTITSQPQSRTNNAGSIAIFAVGASSPAPLTYQWYKGNTPLINASNILGATNSVMVVADVSDSDVGTYSVQISNFAGTVTSSNVTLTVIDPPVATILTSANETNAATTTATFTVTAGGTPPFTYQWTKITPTSTNTLADGGNISGSTSNVLTITNVLAADQAEYLVTIGNPAGSTTTNGMLYVLDPYIFGQPASVTNTLGSTVSFSVTAAGTAPLGYQWQQAGVSLPGATSNILTLNNINDSEAGNYTVIVSNSFNEATSAVATLTITHPPVITHQPANVTVNQGQTATFTVAVNGDSPFTYLWYQNGLPAAGANVSGATTKQLVITNATPLNAGTYYVAITNDVGQTNSIFVTLTVVVPPAITNQPVGLTNLAGSTATFTVGASGTSPAYQWYQITAAATNVLADGGNIFGSASNVLTITNVLGANDGYYFAVATNQAGIAASSNAILVVIDPIITNEPASMTANLGGPASFGVGAYGTSPQYQWYKDGTGIHGATSATYAIASVADTDRGNYTVVVTNIYGVVTSTPPATLTVIDPPVITGQPQNVTANAGTTATFTVNNTGTAPTYQWYFDGNPLSNGPDVSGATNATLMLSNVQDANAGMYKVILSNAAATVISSNATLSVIDPPVLATLQPSAQTNMATTTAQFTVNVTGTAPFNYQWTKITATSTNILSDVGNISGSSSNVLTITNVLGADQAEYLVTVHNPAGTVTTNGMLFVIDPAIFAQPVGQTNFLGNTAVFSVTAAGTSPLHYQWYQDGSPLFGANSNVLTLRNISDSAAGTYTVVINNSVGSVTSAPAILVTVAPLITQQPANVITLVGLTANFSVNVNGEIPFSYQWQFNGTNIAGATNRIYSIASVVLANVGSYQVIVQNPVATQLSDPATLTIGPAAVLTAMPLSNGQPVFMLNGVQGFMYTIQGTTNLNLPVWLPVLTNNAPFTFTNQSSNPDEFYRALYQP